MKNLIRIKMLGKDSVPYDETIEIDPIVYDQIEKLIKGKNQNDKIFDSVNYTDVNAYFKTLSKDCTPKLLRTVKCNEVLVQELKKQKVDPNDSVSVKIRAMFNANLAIAKTLNHQKNVGKNQKEQEGKAKEKLEASKARIKEIKEKGKAQLLKLKEELKACEAVWTGKKLKEKKLAIKEKKEKIEARLEKAIQAAEKAEFNLDKKKLTKDINLGTSLAAYADNRIIYSWCETFGVPIEKIYSPAQRKNSDWAVGIDKDFWKNYP